MTPHTLVFNVDTKPVYCFANSFKDSIISKSSCVTLILEVIGSCPGFVTVISIIVPSGIPVEKTALK